VSEFNLNPFPSLDSKNIEICIPMSVVILHGKMVRHFKTWDLEFEVVYFFSSFVGFISTNNDYPPKCGKHGWEAMESALQGRKCDLCAKFIPLTLWIVLAKL